MSSQKHVTLHVENIDLDLLRRQRLELLNMEDGNRPEELNTIEGILNVLDVMIDNYDQENNTESLYRNAPSGASGTLSGRTENPKISVTAEELELMDLNPESEFDRDVEERVHAFREFKDEPETSDGSTASYYKLPENAHELQDIISADNMNGQIAEIFRKCKRYGKVSHSEKLRDAKGMRFYIDAEIQRLEDYEL